MGLNIKNAETHRLATEVARLTGESKTQAITVSLRERLERLQRERDLPAILAKIESVLEPLAPETPEDHASLLYDERGWPA